MKGVQTGVPIIYFIVTIMACTKKVTCFWSARTPAGNQRAVRSSRRVRLPRLWDGKLGSATVLVDADAHGRGAYPFGIPFGRVYICVNNDTKRPDGWTSSSHRSLAHARLVQGPYSLVPSACPMLTTPFPPCITVTIPHPTPPRCY